MKELTKLEEIFLLSIWRLQENAYGVKIRKDIFKQTGKKISYGALYFTLDQIYTKGYVTKTIGDTTPVRGGVRKAFYNLTPEGKLALKHAFELNNSIWKDIVISVFD